MKAKFDNPWLVYVLFTLCPIYGFAFGWIFGPIFVHAPGMLAETDNYGWGFLPNFEVAVAGFIFGLIFAGCVVYKLAKTANIKIPDETLGHSDDPELDAENGWHQFYADHADHADVKSSDHESSEAAH